MATLVVRGKGENYVRLRMDGLLNPMTSYVNIRINNSTTGAGSANLNSGGGTDDGGATYYSDEWTSSNLSPSTFYNFSASVETTRVYWYYTSTTTSASTAPPPAPSTPSLSVVPSTTSAVLYASWTDAASNYTLQWRVSGSGSAYSNYNTTGTSYTISGLLEATQYEVRVQGYDCNANGCSYSLWDYEYPTTVSERPLNWSWYTSKTSGTNFNITATEWNAFCGRINEFRVYKGLSNYSFTSAVSGNNAQASQINQARTAINAMSPPTSVPSSVSGGGNCLPSTVNGLRDSLNSVA